MNAPAGPDAASATAVAPTGPAAVFAEGRDPALWRRPIPNARVAASADRILRRALDAIDTPIPALGFALYRRFDVDDDRMAFQNAYFDRRRRLYAAAIGALLSDEVPISEAEDAIWAICDEYAWALPAHIPELSAPHPEVPHDEIIDLFSAETAFFLAEIANLLEGRLHPLVRARIEREVERRVFTPFRERVWFWETVETNWSGVCAAGVGIAALHLDASGLDAILDRCTAAMGAMMDGYGDDGVCVEGLNYWSYGFGHFVMYAEALRQSRGVDLWAGTDRWSADKAAIIAGFAAQVSLGGRAVAAFSDSAAFGLVSPAMVTFLERRDPTVPHAPVELWAEQPETSHNWGLLVRTFVWARDAAPDADLPLAPDRWLADAEWLVARRMAEIGGDSVEVGFAAKGGNNAEPHNHNDLGSFVFAVAGEPLLSELGMGLYDGRYFLEEYRYGVPTAGSHGHSVPIVGGVRQHHGPHARALVERVSVAPEGAELTLDLRAGYDVPELQELTRELRFRGPTMQVRDRFAASAPLEFVDRLVSLFPIALEADGAIILGERSAVRLSWDATRWTPRLATLEYRTHEDEPATAFALDLSTVDVAAECVVTIEVVTP
ncbi:heparinase II/III family protein [Microbacterium sp. NEAU-LLC]|uniref:Heparinase II/III family protein n=1 Tax=Microbacterium helvum TaxID=2773713 RepID=A0ABR8NPG6_9MICO|nr:heparinase II/III family protein [Microbacterium helvum]MBD3942074.1 heparinase II/III family protein [Microbacterium helvum]